MPEKYTPSKLTIRLIHGSCWVLIGTISSRLSILISSLFLTRILGKAGFGKFAMLNSTQAMFMMFAGFALGTTATKYIAELRESDKQRAGRIIALTLTSSIITGIICMLIAFFLAPHIAATTLKATDLSCELRLMSYMLFFSAINGVLLGVLTGFEAFNYIAVINIFTALATITFRTVGAWKWGLYGAVFGMLLVVIIQTFISIAFSIKLLKQYNFKIKLNGMMQESKIFLHFILPSVANGLAILPVTWGVRVLLVRHTGGYSALGIYAAAYQIFTIMMFLPGVIAQVLLPMMSNSINSKNHSEVKELLINTVKINILITFPLLIIFGILSPLIMRMYGSGFEKFYFVLILVLIDAGLFAIYRAYGSVFTASGKIWPFFIMHLIWGALYLILTYLLINDGAAGLAASGCIARAALMIMMIVGARHILKNKQKLLI